MKLRFPLQLHMSIVLLLMIALVGGVLGGFSYIKLSGMIEDRAQATTRVVTRELLGDLDDLIDPAEVTVGLLSRSGLTEAWNLKDRLKRLSLLTEALNDSPILSSVYIGYDTGDFFLVRNVANESMRTNFNAPEGTRYMVQSIEKSTNPPTGRFMFYDANLNLLREDSKPDYPKTYDPRVRKWYQEAMGSSTTILTQPYRFHFDHLVGETIAKRSAGSQAIVGADIALAELGSDIAKFISTPSMRLLITDDQGKVIAYDKPEQLDEKAKTSDELTRIDDIGVPLLSGLGNSIRNFKGNDPLLSEVSIDGVDWRVTIYPWKLEGGYGTVFLVSAIPAREILAEAYQLLASTGWITIAIILLMVPIALLVAHAISKPLRLLGKEAESIQRFEFSEPIRVNSMIIEVDDVAKAMERMKQTINRFLDTIQMISSEANFERLLPLLLTATISNSDAEAGILYLFDNEAFVPSSALCGEESFKDALHSIPLEKTGALLKNAIESGRPVLGVLTEEEVKLIGLDKVALDIHSRQCIIVPLLNRGSQLLGGILLFHGKSIEESQLTFIKALTDTSSITLETRELIKSQKELFEAFIQLLAGAIDAKSAYTGGHCERVPELTKMLARAACNQKEGVFSGFQLDDKEWEAVHIAAWLHDCGKIVTPVEVVDKATKLEMIYDRIHEVRMRFEVLKRDAEIHCLKKIAEGENEAAAREALAMETNSLDDDFAFIASCNEGGEFMSNEKIERLRAIAAKTWTRTIDNRMGTSVEERQRMGPAETPLPVDETLLADKPEHCYVRKEHDKMPENNPWGFKMPEPKLLYNKGELYNLSVGRGTLSEEDRYKINEHITQTIMMLTALPFPKHLRTVPEIAGGHHEKMDGTGYPKRLKQDELSPVARMMAIADIYEALTAVDRPYKKGKTISEAIKIMSFMKKDKHIDADLFELFLRSGIYLEYAKSYLNPNQIDEVDIEKYLS